MSGDERPQDVGRRRTRRSPAPAPETAAVLDRYRSMMRRELGSILDVLAHPATNGQEPEVRAKRWDLAIKLGRELGSRDYAGEEPAPPASSRGGAGAPKLSAKERKSLG